jgi:hypothetical protein
LCDIFESQVSHKPIINYKDHMFLVFDLVNNFIPLSKGVTHDSDKHVHHMDHDNEARHPEDHLQQRLHSLLS